MKSIILAGGGTAGHITPHLAIMPQLKKHFDKIYYFGSGKQIEKKLMQNEVTKIYDLSPPAFVRSLSLKNLLIPFKLYKAVKECEAYLKQINPSVIFSKGGYCALPVCIAGFNLKIPVISHESDLTLGLANKLAVKRSTCLLTTFEQTAKGQQNAQYVGPLLRQEFFNKNKSESKKLLGITGDKPILLVTGGSQGSKTINQALYNNLQEILRDFSVIHLYGKSNKPPYKAINGYYGFSFADMPTAISACDIALSRGGSNTLFELLCTNTPSLIIPLKKASRGDQIKNAEYFYNKNALLMADEEDLDKSIISLVKELYSNRQALKEEMKNLNLQSGVSKTIEIILRHAKKANG